MPQPWADNGAFVINALDNLSGTDALIGVRSRGRFTRPFVVVEALQRQAENRFRERRRCCNSAWPIPSRSWPSCRAGPRTGIGALRRAGAGVAPVPPGKVRIRKELREVRYQLNADIEALGRTLKFANIALVPLVLTLGVLALWLWRRRRSA